MWYISEIFWYSACWARALRIIWAVKKWGCHRHLLRTKELHFHFKTTYSISKIKYRLLNSRGWSTYWVGFTLPVCLLPSHFFLPASCASMSWLFYLPPGNMYLALPGWRGPNKSQLSPKEEYHGPDLFMTPICPHCSYQTQHRILSYTGEDFWEVRPIFQLKTSVLSRCGWWNRNSGKKTLAFL